MRDISGCLAKNHSWGLKWFSCLTDVACNCAMLVSKTIQSPVSIRHVSVVSHHVTCKLVTCKVTCKGTCIDIRQMPISGHWPSHLLGLWVVTPKYQFVFKIRFGSRIMISAHHQFVPSAMHLHSKSCCNSYRMLEMSLSRGNELLKGTKGLSYKISFRSSSFKLPAGRAL